MVVNGSPGFWGKSMPGISAEHSLRGFHGLGMQLGRSKWPGWSEI